MSGFLISIPGHVPMRPAFLAPTACVIGQVTFGADCSVWFGAVIRGDINRISFGNRCNVQDLACAHVSKSRPCVVGDGVSLGHGAIIHACTIDNGALIGLGARVLDGAHIGAGALVAAGCVVPEGCVVPPGHLIAGVPGRIVKPLGAALAERIGRIAGDYVAYQALYPELSNAGKES